MHMDTFLEGVDIVEGINSEQPAMGFADDVVLSTRDEESMQRLLDWCTKWADIYHMTWSIPKCVVLTTENVLLTLAGERVETATETEYLGSTISIKYGVTDMRMRKSD